MLLIHVTALRLNESHLILACSAENTRNTYSPTTATQSKIETVQYWIETFEP